MDDMFRQLARHTDRVRLTDDERAAMRSRIETLTQAMPVMRDVPAPATTKTRLRDRLRFPVLSRAKAIPVFGLVAALALSGGTAFAAEGSLPGDPLYPVKVNVIEQVQGALAVTPEAKAAWASARAARRLDEAEKLAAKGKLDARTGAAIEANFKKFADNAQQRVNELSASGNADAAASASSGLEAALTAHERILATLAQEKVGPNVDIGALTATVKTATKDSADVRARTEQQVGRSGAAKLERAAKERRSAAQRKIDEASSVIAAVDAASGTDATAGAKSALADAKTAFAQGDAQVTAGGYDKAFASFELAARDAQQAKMLADAQTELHVRIGAGPADGNKEQDRGNDGKAGTSPAATVPSSTTTRSAAPFVGTGVKVSVPGLVGGSEDDARIGVGTSSGVHVGGDDSGEREGTNRQDD